MAVIHSVHREPGHVEIDRATCHGCGLCASICPTETLRMEDRELRIHTDSPLGCIACGHCMMVCPEGAVRVTGRGISPDDLVPLSRPEERASAGQLAALMMDRRSIRHFADRAVEAETLERIIQMAASAPMGIPPWDVGCVIVSGRTKVRAVATQIAKGYAGMLRLFRPWVLPLLRPFMGRTVIEQFRTFVIPLGETYVRFDRAGKDAIFYDAPAVLIFHHSPYADAADAMIACTYAMLAAEAMGMGTTMIGGAAPVLRRNKALCAELGIPRGNTPAIALIVGHPRVKFHRSIRRAFSSVSTACSADQDHKEMHA